MFRCFAVCFCRAVDALAGAAFPVLRKHADSRVTCLGAYVVVDVLERWTGDKSRGRSVAGVQPACASDAIEAAGDSGSKAASGCGFRFYHAVLQRVGEWSTSVACASSAAAAASSGSSCVAHKSNSASGGVKRKRR